MVLYFSGADTNFTFFFEKATYGVLVTMENTEYQTTLELRENITFDEKVEIEDLVLPSEQTGTPKMENKDIKEEPMDPQFSSAHEGRKQSGFSSFQNEMEKDIAKLLKELDMMSWHDHDQMRVKKIQQVVEKYQRIEPQGQMNSTVEMLEKNLEARTTELTKLKQESQSASQDFDLKINLMSSENYSLKEKFIKIAEEHSAAMSLNSKTMSSIVKLHEKALDDTNNELNNVKVDLQIAKSTNVALSNRVQELELSSNNQVHDKKEKFKTSLKTFDNEETLANYYVNLKKVADKESKTARPFAYKSHRKSKKACDRQETENVFTCDTCPKIFKTKKGLSQHRQTHDKNSRKLCCPQEECGMKFYNKTSFDNHMNVHNGIKPHKCRDCGKAYADSGARNKHFRKYHQ